MPIFNFRSEEIEEMDNLHCEGEVVDQTLKELEVINRLLGGNQVTIRGVAQLLKERKTKETINITDLGCGGGDILKLVANWGRKNKVSMQLTGIDANPNIVAYAMRNSKDYPEINYKAVNIFSNEFKSVKTDIVLATLFMHHFTDVQLIEAFQSLKRQARIGIVINDIHRHWFAYHSIKMITRYFSRSKMVQADAPVSVLRAFHKDELRSIVEKAGITSYTLRWKWAFRWELIISNR